MGMEPLVTHLVTIDAHLMVMNLLSTTPTKEFVAIAGHKGH